jgi:hypothetical protein
MKTTNTDSHIFGSDDRPVFRIIIYCLSLAFSGLIASLETLRPTTSGFSFHLSWRTLLTFLIGVAIFVPCFKTIFLSPNKRGRVAGLALVVVVGLVSFLFPLRFVPTEEFGALFTGLSIAVCFVSTIGGILFVISRFLNADERQTELEAQAPKV